MATSKRPRLEPSSANKVPSVENGVESTPASERERVLSLQGLAGNRAVTSLVRASDPRAGIGRGAPLPDHVAADMGASFGADFNDVRVHADEEANRAASDRDAAAYTVGHDIVFSRGWYLPDSGSGRRLLAHELMHVLQQPAVSPSSSVDAGENVSLESDAERAAATVESGEPIAGPVVTSGAPVVARQPAEASGGEEKGLWASLRDRALDYMVRESDAAIDRDITKLRGLVANLSPELFSIADTIIDVIYAALHTILSIFYFVFGTLVGFVEGIVDMIVGALMILFKIGEFVVLIFNDLIVTVMRGFGVDRTSWRADRSATMLKAGLEAIVNLPSSIKVSYDKWAIEFRAVPPERKAFMLGQLFGQVLAVIATSGAGAARAGKAAQLAEAAAPAFEASATGEATMGRFAMASMLGPKEAALLGGAAPVIARGAGEAAPKIEAPKEPKESPKQAKKAEEPAPAPPEEAKPRSRRELDLKETNAARDRLQAAQNQRVAETNEVGNAKAQEMMANEALRAAKPLPPVPPELEPLLADVRKIEDPAERFAALDALAERPGLSPQSYDYLEAAITRRRLTQSLSTAEEAKAVGEGLLDRLVDVELPAAIRRLSTAAQSLANRLRKVGPNYAAKEAVTYDEILEQARWDQLAAERKAAKLEPLKLATDHLYALDRIVKSEEMAELLRVFDKAPQSVRRRLTDRIVALGDIKENLVRMRGDANGASLKSNKSWYDIKLADAKRFGYEWEDILEMQKAETEAQKLIDAEIANIIQEIVAAL